MTDAYQSSDLAVLERQIDEWLGALAANNERIVAIDRAEDDIIRWYVRMRGDDKEFTTVWLTLGQRTLRYETYVMPAPEEQHRELFEQLLRRNDTLVGVDEFDRILGTLYAQVEQCFVALLRIGFASRFPSGTS